MKSITTIGAVLATVLLANITSNLTADDKGDGDRAADVFAAIDENSDGQITAKELSESKHFRDKDKKDVGAAFKEKDLNGDGGISEHEFKKTFGENRGKGGPGPKGKGKGGQAGGDKGENGGGKGKGGPKGKGGKG